MSFHVRFNVASAEVDTDCLAPIATAARHRRAGGDGQRRAVFIWSDPDAKPIHAAHVAELEDRLLLVGRVRLDARDEICATLSSGARSSLTRAPDVLLCLHAYAKWGEQFLDHLRGDFCFVLWDEDRQRLICARDQLGVRPLFYACAGSNWHISDSLDSVASERSLRTDLDEFWIADFLGNGVCIDFDRTVYRDIKRVPPAHVVEISQRGCFVRKYWSLKVDKPINYRDPAQYIEHFNEVLGLAVADRLPQTRVGISMSGGLDSSTLAAHALKITGNASQIVAHTRTFESIMPHHERHFSSLVADKLDIECVHRKVDDVHYDRNWQKRGIWTPEPNISVTSAALERTVEEEMLTLADVWFYGEGPDNALQFEWKPYLRWLAGRRDWSGFAGAVVKYVRVKQMREWRGTIKRALRQSAEQSQNATNEGPGWLSIAFAKDVNLTDRFREYARQTPFDHPWHPRAMASFNSTIWQTFLESFDASISNTSLDWRHPYLDLRVLHFLLAVPPIPWARRKHLLREAMRGILPDEVVERDKAPLLSDPQATIMKAAPLPSLNPEGPVWRFLDAAVFHDAVLAGIDPHQLLRVHVLDRWLSDRT
jgi:asparagine synthase (glutamine-hydrolysing)